MKYESQRRVVVTLLVLLVAMIGCDKSPSTTKAVDTRTPAQYFKEEQARTETEYGKIMTNTVEEKDDKILFSTEDGKRWSVGYSKRADGTYQYGTPVPVK